MNPYVKLLYQALSSPHGLIVTHENPQSARSQFYAARKKHGDPELNRISVTILEGEPTRLYLIHSLESKDAETGDSPDQADPCVAVQR